MVKVKAQSLVTANDVNRELYVRNAELAVRNKTLQLLHQMGDVTLRALEVDDMVKTIVQVLDDEFAYPLVAIGLCDASARHLVWKAFASTKKKLSRVLPVTKWTPITLTSHTNVCAQALRTQRRHATTSLGKVLATETPKEELQVLTQGTEVKSTLILPLISSDRPIGVLVVGLNRSSKELTRYEREAFQSLLSLVTVAIEKAETYGKLQHTTKQLRVANHHLRELDSLKTEFLSIASHQLRTPLAVVKGYIGMLKGGMLGDMLDKQKETLGKMEAGTEQLIMLVNHLLDVSRIESKRLQVRLEPVDLRIILDTLVKFVQGKADDKKIILQFVMPAEPLMVKVDLEKVKEVFMNLLDNAIKYTDVGSVEIRMTVDKGQVKTAIHDTGHGLTVEDQGKLFQKFVTGSASKHVQVTTGLGLFVCKKLTEAMQGTVVAESQGADQGSTFTVAFPAAT